MGRESTEWAGGLPTRFFFFWVLDVFFFFLFFLWVLCVVWHDAQPAWWPSGQNLGVQRHRRGRRQGDRREGREKTFPSRRDRERPKNKVAEPPRKK